LQQNSFDGKMKIMRNKNKLRGKEIYIEDDLTNKKREVQYIIRQKAKEERKKRKRVKVGYNKICI